MKDLTRAVTNHRPAKGTKAMLRQALQDAVYTLHITGSLTAALVIAAAPIAQRFFHR
jgi:hypothetical protein